ncbi:hypothetical protein BGZ97_011326 [Linnemannia gamsii]|uniref:Phosphatidylglycerol/phosphatidylinositol transfer protein n=1 Tax=Linnemannia gamsii TaxID=64522 RepID=A0A9P6RNS7_9FUNG|nr:hypothetical protein BGZ97_011326 [Linnemannia gamsii]
MKFAAVIASAAAFIAAASQASPLVWTNCAPPGAVVSDVSFKMDGEWACVGEKVCGTLTGIFPDPIIQGSKLVVSVKYLGRITNTFNADLCTVLGESGYNCPVPAGPKTIHACIHYNGEVVNIPGNTTMYAYNGDSKYLFCQASTVMNKNCTLSPNP